MSNDKYVILRHDVDAKPWNSLKTAQIEHALGAKATYYFRVGAESNVPEVIKSCSGMRLSMRSQKTGSEFGLRR